MTHGPLGTTKVIAYRASAWASRIGGGLLVVVLLVGSLLGALEYLGERTLTCRDGACTLSYWHPLLANRREIIPAGSIQEVRLRKHASRRTTQVRVLLITGEKTIELGRGPLSAADADEQKAKLDAFLAAPEENTVTIVTEPFSVAVVVITGWVAALALLYGWFLSWRRRVVIDRASGRLHLESLRWPATAARRTFPLHEVSHAEWGEEQVNLVLANGQRVPLSKPDRKGGDHEDTANAINEALTSGR
ncbi:MAG: hypothetical protein HYV09_20590 [Deltaproteobacteria bacterium]|nr:hypothetical protein [Deltaproteobacteria bacterium]